MTPLTDVSNVWSLRSLISWSLGVLVWAVLRKTTAGGLVVVSPRTSLRVLVLMLSILSPTVAMLVSVVRMVGLVSGFCLTVW